MGRSPAAADILDVGEAPSFPRRPQPIGGLPVQSFDLAKAKVTIDRLIDPGIDAAATLAQLDAMAKSLRTMLPAGASKRLTLDALRYHVYKASPWNDNRPLRAEIKRSAGEPGGVSGKTRRSELSNQTVADAREPSPSCTTGASAAQRAVGSIITPSTRKIRNVRLDIDRASARAPARPNFDPPDYPDAWDDNPSRAMLSR